MLSSADVFRTGQLYAVKLYGMNRSAVNAAFSELDRHFRRVRSSGGAVSSAGANSPWFAYVWGRPYREFTFGELQAQLKRVSRDSLLVVTAELAQLPLTANNETTAQLASASPFAEESTVNEGAAVVSTAVGNIASKAADIARAVGNSPGLFWFAVLLGVGGYVAVKTGIIAKVLR